MKFIYKWVSGLEWFTTGTILIRCGNHIAKMEQYPDIMHHVSNLAQATTHAICAYLLWYASDRIK